LHAASASASARELATGFGEADGRDLRHRRDELLDASDLVDAYTTSADVRASKPEPDIVHAAI
jgi:beta-phosphoglucomutase-like phosphatase (HAD superfamily)